jgi:hypothetical protein
MTTLTGRTPMASYQELLKLDGGRLDSTLRSVEDGLGLASPLKLSTVALAIHGLTFPSTGATAGKVLAVAAGGTSLEWIPAPSAVTSVAGKTGDVILNSGDIIEGANLYYTDVRASAAAPVQSIAGKTGDVTIVSSDVGLGNVENKSSSDIRSELTIGNVTTALGYTPESITAKNAPNGYAGLGATGKISNSQLPALAITDTFVVASEAAMLALTGAETGDVAIRTDLNKTFILRGTAASTLADWSEILSPVGGGGGVTSVNGQTGAATVGDVRADGSVAMTGTLTGTAFRAAQGVPNNADSSTNGFAFGADGDTGLFSPIVGGSGANGVVALYANDFETLRATQTLVEVKTPLTISSSTNHRLVMGNGVGVASIKASLGNGGEFRIDAGIVANTTASTLMLVGGSGWGTGGNATLIGGEPTGAGAGGWSVVQGGRGLGGGAGGHVYINGGHNPDGGNAGDVFVQGGDGGNWASVNGGNVYIRGGSNGGQGGNAGFVSVLTGGGIERLRVARNGAWSVGQNGTNFGTAGQVLTTTGPTTPPTWQDAVWNGGTVTNGITIATSTNQLFLGTSTSAEAKIMSIPHTMSGFGGLNIISGGTSTGNAAPILIQGGAGGSSGTASGVTIVGGQAGGTGSGGAINITGGTGGSMGSTAGTVTINGGPAVLTNMLPGLVTIAGGNATHSENTASAGAVLVRGGDGTSGNTATGGNLTLRGGNGSNGAGGNVFINAGVNSGAAAGGFLSLSTGPTTTLVERLRILNNGAWSVGTGGAATGTSGQALVSNGSGAAPTWQTVGTGDFKKDGSVAMTGTLTGTAFRAAIGVPNSSDSSTNGFAFGADGDTGLFSPVVDGGTPANGVAALFANNTEALRATPTLVDVKVALNVTSNLTLAGSAGTTGQVLTSNGSGAAPTWTTVSGGGAAIPVGEFAYGTGTSVTSQPAFKYTASNGSFTFGGVTTPEQFSYSVISGAHSSTGVGGALSLNGGNGASSSAGGDLYAMAGTGGSNSGTGGTSSINGGYGGGANGRGGDAIVQGGIGQGTGQGGNVAISAGTSNGGAQGGRIDFYTSSEQRLRIAANGSWVLGSGGNAGTAGQALVSNGSSSAPTWQTITAAVGVMSSTPPATETSPGTPGEMRFDPITKEVFVCTSTNFWRKMYTVPFNTPDQGA